jgi:hypothetical protein
MEAETRALGVPPSRFLSLPRGKTQCLLLLCRFIDWEKEIRDMIYRYLFYVHRRCKIFPNPMYAKPKVFRNPQILQVNRQIYSEASSILYSDVMVWLNKRLVSILAIHAGIRTPSQPPDYVLSRNQDEEKRTWIVNQHKLDTFARFKRVAFEIWFGVPAGVPALDNDRGNPEKFTFIPEDTAWWPALFKAQGSIVKDFVWLLSKSPKVNQLSVTIRMMVIGREIQSQPSLADTSTGKGEEVTGKVLEALLESGQFTPLKELSNVKRFDIRLSFGSFPPGPRHTEILQELKHAVEGNYVEIHET